MLERRLLGLAPLLGPFDVLRRPKSRYLRTVCAFMLGLAAALIKGFSVYISFVNFVD